MANMATCGACGGKGDVPVIITLPSGRKWQHWETCNKCQGKGQV